MLFFYIRHGDPIYNPDSLTPLGERQAESVAKRLALFGIDEIYASTSNRAILTSKPTCELLKKEASLVDFANENHAWKELTIEREGKKRAWLFEDAEMRNLFTEEAITNLGHNWFTYPGLEAYKAGIDRIYSETIDFFKSLGYAQIGKSGKYEVINKNDKRVALFAHQGFGLTFLSCVLGIPYPAFVNHFDMCHSGMTVIEFDENNGISIPRVKTLSSDSHLYRDGLPLHYNHYLHF